MDRFKVCICLQFSQICKCSLYEKFSPKRYRADFKVYCLTWPYHSQKKVHVLSVEDAGNHQAALEQVKAED